MCVTWDLLQLSIIQKHLLHGTASHVANIIKRTTKNNHSNVAFHTIAFHINQEALCFTTRTLYVLHNYLDEIVTMKISCKKLEAKVSIFLRW